MRRRDALRVGALAVAGSVAGCLGGPPQQATVEMTDDLAFVPETVAVAAGGTVTWETVGSVAHSVTAYGDGIPGVAAYFASGGFETERAARRGIQAGLVGPDETYEHRFADPGTYRYFCVPHESAGMTGTVRVEQ